MMNGYDMDKRFIIGVCTGIAILGMVTYFPTIAEALYSIPPTDAWDQIIFRYGNWTVTNDDNINATSYSDNLYLISDGSILFNVTKYP